MATRIKLRRDTAANWLQQNPILALGEPGYETNTRMMKMGDGVTSWADLKYAVTGDLKVTDDTIHGDMSVSLSSGIGNRENWILLTQAVTDDLTNPVDALVDGVAYDSMGNVFTMGWYDRAPWGTGCYLQKVSPSGEVLFNNYYNESSSYGFGMSVDKNDDVIMILGENDSSSDDLVLVKVSGDDGAIVWQKYINSYGDNNDYASCIDTDAQGNIFITGNGQNSGPDGNDAAYVAKFSGTNGTLIWSKQYDIDLFDSTGTGLTVDKDGNIGVVGTSYGPGAFVNMFKINGTDGSIMGQGKILNVKWDRGNNDGQIDGDIHFADIESSDITSDSQGNFYLTFNWYSPYYPGVTAFVTKFNGTTCKSEWARMLTYDDFYNGVGSVICDELNNVYVSSTLRKSKNDYDIGSSNRPTQNITKINSTGSIVWQRWFSQEQATTVDGKTTFYNNPIGQSIRVNKDYVVVAGNYYSTYDYSNTSGNWTTQPYVAQLNRDGGEFDINGWKFVDSLKDTQTLFASVISDADNYIYDPANVSDFNVTVTNGDVGYSMNTDLTNLVYINKSNVNKVTFAEKTLMLPEGGTLELGREKLGYITAIGTFDGPEGGNTNGAVWFNGSDRDEKGATYAAGGWYTYDTWNDWDSYEAIPMVFKTDADGKLIWQAGNALDQSWSNPDLVDVVYHQPTNTVVALGNDGELDGHEGFNVMYLDADTGSMKQDITHIRPAEGSNDIHPTTLSIMSDGSPVVAGYITGSKATYANVTVDGAGLTGSTNNGTLVVLKSKFTVNDATEYPQEDGTWALYPDNAEIYSVNRYGHDDAYPTIAYTGTLGSAATFDITIAGGNVTGVAINAAGSGYKAGHKVTIAGSQLGGTTGNGMSVFVTTVDGSGGITAIDTTYATESMIDGTYTGVATTAVAGTLPSVWVQYAPEGTVYSTVYIDNGGNGWGVGDTFKILGTALGGASPANDLTFAVDTLNGVGSGLGGITAITSIAGTPQSLYIKLYGGSADYTQAGQYNVVHELSTDSFIWTPTWSKVFGATGVNIYDDLHGLTLDTSDNVIVSGYTDNSGITGTWYNGSYPQTGIVSKFSSEGELLWSKSIDGSEGYSTVWGVATDMDDNIYSVMVSNNADGDPYITKLDTDGNFVWQQSIVVDNSNSWAIDVADNGDVMIAGNCWRSQWMANDYHHYNWNILVVKFDKDGNKLFSRLLWSTSGIGTNNNDSYSNQLTIKGDRFSFVAYSNDPGGDNYQGITVDLPLDGTGIGDYGDFHYEEIETITNYRWTDNGGSGFNKVTNITTQAIRPYVFVSAPYINDDAWRNVSIYGDRQAEVQTIYKSEGAEIKGVAKITFEDGSVQTSSMQGLPQVKLSQTDGNRYDYFLRPEDNGKHIVQMWGRTVIIPSPDRVELPVGFAFTIINANINGTGYGDSSGVWCENNNETIWLSGDGGNNNYSYEIPHWSMATIVKFAPGQWMITGAGVTSGWW